MGKRTGRPRGRPEKAPEERALRRTFTFSPELWERIEAAVPARERSAWFADAARDKLAHRGTADGAPTREGPTD